MKSFALGCLILAAITAAFASAAGEKTQLAKFMRRKLTAATEITEGLASQNTAVIKRGTAIIAEMTKTEHWNVMLDEDYRKYDREFRAAIERLDILAEDEEFDDAIYQWSRAIRACMNCHKQVRAKR